MAENQEVAGKPVRRGVSPALIVAGVIAVLLVIFIVQNSDGTKVTWLFIETREAPLWTVIFVSALVGYLVGRLLETGVRRSRRGG